MRVIAPSAAVPPAAHYLAAHRVASFDLGDAWRMKLELDHGAQRLVRDLRPDLPLMIRY